MAGTSTGAKPASTRKKATKRGPTKAASLKALGLTQEDLDAIKELKTLREEVATKVEAKRTEEPYLGRSGDAFFQQPIEPGAHTAEKPELQAPEAPTFFARNLRNTEVGFRIARQEGQGKKRFELKPRGQRGDLVKLRQEDLNDDNIINNIEYGVIEIITAPEAKSVIEKQVTNAQTRVHPAMALLRNELGQPYEEGAIHGAEEYVDQSVTVAQLTPVGGEFGEIQFDRQNKGSFNRDVTAQPIGNPSIISDGFARNDEGAAADAVARRKDLQGPAAGLGGVKVTVGETQRT